MNRTDSKPKQLGFGLGISESGNPTGGLREKWTSPRAADCELRTPVECLEKRGELQFYGLASVRI